MRIAVIPARGGSKRIPKKNIRSFNGLPIIAYSIQAASQSGLFDRIIVSTDDHEISEIANKFGAETPFVRPKELSDDFTPTVPVIKHAVEWASVNWGQIFDVCCIYATAPLISRTDLKSAFNLYKSGVKGYVFTATSFGFPIQRTFSINDDGYCKMFHPEHYNTRSQDLEEAYQDAGQFYWGSADSFLSDKIFFSPDSKPYLLPRHCVQDIDTLEDWTRAELMWKLLDK